MTLYGATFGAEAISFGAILTTLPFLLANSYGLTAVWIGSIITVSTVAAAVASASNGRLAERFSNPVLLALGFVAYGASLLGTWLAPGPLFIAAAVFVFGTGSGLILPSVDAAISDVAPPEFRAGAISVRNSTTFLGRTVGPVSFTGVAALTGYRPLLLGASVLAFAVGAVTYATTR